MTIYKNEIVGNTGTLTFPKRSWSEHEVEELRRLMLGPGLTPLEDVEIDKIISGGALAPELPEVFGTLADDAVSGVRA